MLLCFAFWVCWDEVQLRGYFVLYSRCICMSLPVLDSFELRPTLQYNCLFILFYFRFIGIYLSLFDCFSMDSYFTYTTAHLFYSILVQLHILVTIRFQDVLVKITS